MAQSSEPAGWSLSKHLVSLLRVNENGWNVSLFQKQNIVDTALCGNCNEVCRGAVELGCDHDDKEIVLFCNSCLKDLISTNDNKCPINQHLDPIVSPVRSLRRQILQSSVICPYSVEYKRRNKNANIDNQVVMDTIGGDQKEGAPVAAASDEIIDGCTEWKGTLDELLNSDHLRQCTLKYDATGIQKLEMEKVQNEKQSLHRIIEANTAAIRGLEADKRTQQERIEQLEAENRKQIQTIQELRTNVQHIHHVKQQLEATKRANTDLEAKQRTQQEQIQSLKTNVQDTQQQLQAKARTISALQAEKNTQQQMIQELHSNVANLSADQQRNVTQLKESLSLQTNDNSQRFAWLRSEDDEKKENDLELVKIVAD
eukprot:256930_1